MVSFNTIIAIGLVVGFLVAGGSSLVKPAIDEAKILKNKLKKDEVQSG